MDVEMHRHGLVPQLDSQMIVNKKRWHIFVIPINHDVTDLLQHQDD